MEGKQLVFVFLQVLVQLVLSRACPSGTPSQCRCDNSVFNCSGAGLSSIPAGISNVYDEIDLSYNNLVDVPTGSFVNLNLRSINLAGNQITEISPGAFDTLSPDIPTTDASPTFSINLAQNSLQTVEQAGFNLVPLISVFSLDGNPIDCTNPANDWLKTIIDASGIVSGNCASGTTIETYISDSVSSQGDPIFSFETTEFEGVESDGMVKIAILRRGTSSTRIQFSVSATATSTATLAADFVPDDTTQTMLEDQTRMVIDILIVDDDLQEQDEDFTVSLSIMSRGEGNVASVGTPGTATVWIRDNDTPVEVPTTTPAGETETAPERDSTLPPGAPQVTTTGDFKTDNMTTLKGPEKVSHNDGVIAAIVVPIVLIIVVLAIIGVVYYYYRSKQAAKGATAGVRYAAVHGHGGRVYGDVTTTA